MSLQNTITSLSEPHVVVVGDLMIDEYIEGTCERLNPEAPVPVLLANNRYETLGGAGNVAANLRALGATVTLVSIAEAYSDGRVDPIVSKLLNDQGLADDAIIGTPDRMTTRKTRVMAGNHHLVRYDRESTEAIDSERAQEVVVKATAALGKADVLVLSDYGKGLLSAEVIERVIAAATRLGVPTIVDPKGLDFAKYGGASVITPNEKEARKAVEASTLAFDSVAKLAEQVQQISKVETVVLTRGANGISCLNKEGEFSHHPTQAVHVYDVVGAGDTVVAALAMGLGSGIEMKEAIDLANFAAIQAVKKAGTTTVTRAELERQARGKHFQKLLTTDQAVQLSVAARSDNKRVVFTNGCFDIIHPGHVHLLEEAKAQGDLLIVGLNSDDSVRRLKGDGRPNHDEISRAQVLCGLKAVDAVVIFGEDTPLSLIERLSPQVLVKGGDYQPEDVVGAELVDTLVIVPFYGTHSTTNLVHKIQQDYRARPDYGATT